MPTSPNPLTDQEWIDAIAKELGVATQARVALKRLVKIIGLFNLIMKELVEMMYQNDRDYVFDSSKFEHRFDPKPTPYLDGIREIIGADYK